jgi:hypothetical protein
LLLPFLLARDSESRTNLLMQKEGERERRERDMGRVERESSSHFL